MKADLSRVTLVSFDGDTCPELAALSLSDSLEQASFADVLVCGPVQYSDKGRYIKTKAWTDRLDFCKFFWYELPEIVTTEYLLIVHYDSWIIDASRWEPKFLDYDYMGAPWWYDDPLNVGHGVLRSLDLMNFMALHKDKFPLIHPEDDYISRKYRPALEEEGFRWPTEQVASRFMFECSRPSPDSKHFMFHDVFNFPAVLPSGEKLEQRLDLVYGNTAATSAPAPKKSNSWKTAAAQ